MSKVQDLCREIRYNAVVFRIMAEKSIPYLVWYGADGRTIEVQALQKGLVLLVKTVPLPDDKVLLIVKPNIFPKAFIEEISEVLLVQKVHKYVRELLT